MIISTPRQEVNILPILKSAFKRVRRDRKKHVANTAIKAELKTLGKKLDKLISDKDTAGAKKMVRLLGSKLDKAVVKDIMHRNTAARKKSRLDLKVHRLAA